MVLTIVICENNLGAPERTTTFSGAVGGNLIEDGRLDNFRKLRRKSWRLDKMLAWGFWVEIRIPAARMWMSRH